MPRSFKLLLVEEIGHRGTANALNLLYS